jgi:similar to stage IV sporulation protein
VPVTAVRRFLAGYLVISIHGAATEKFINLACGMGFPLWDISRGTGSAVFSADVYTYYDLSRLARKTGCRLRIARKAGWPFFYSRLRRRRGLVLGLGLFVGVLYFLSSFILFIRVEGAETLGRERIMVAAEKAGLRPGILKSGIDKERLAAALMLHEPELAWVGINVRGTLLVIEVVERNRPLTGNDRPAHLVAAKDGLVVDVLLVTGEARVRPGDTVRRGQLLIEGVLNPGTYPVAPLPARARGEVWARVWYAGYGDAALQEQAVTRTGRRAVTWTVVVDGKEVLRVGRGGTHFLRFEVETDKQQLPERIVPVPVEIITTIKHELHLQVHELNSEQALALAVKRARNQAELQLPEGVQPRHIDLQQVKTGNEQLVRVRYVLETIENIAIIEKTEGGWQ